MNIMFTSFFDVMRMGGVTFFQKQLIKYLDHDEFTVINLNKIGKDRFVNAKELTEWSEISIKVKLLLFFICFPFNLIIHKADIVHANPSLDYKALCRDACFLLIAKLLHKKTLVFFHGWDKDTEKKIVSSRLWLYLFRSIFGRADLIIVLAEDFKQVLLSMGFTNKICVETTMVDDDLVPMSKVLQKIATLEKKKKIRILFLSRVEKTKGIYEAIDAFMIVSKTHPDIEFAIAGDGVELPAVKKYVQSLRETSIQFLGYVAGSQKQQVLLDSDIFLFPTYTEGMPIALLEAMAFGMAVVIRDVGGIPDIFTHEKNGFSTDSLDPEVFACFIEKIITDRQLLSTIAVHNFYYTKEHFFASKVTKRMEALYRNL